MVLFGEPAHRVEQVLGLVAIVGLLVFDRRAGQEWRWLTWAIPAVVLVILSEVVWGPTRGIVVQGALIGSLTAMFAVGLALIYRANRIVNFAQGDLGAVPALFAILLVAKDTSGGAPDWMTGIPYPVAIVVGLVSAIFLGFIVERTFINRFSRSPRLVLTVATIGIAQLLTALALFMPRWFGFKDIGRPELNPPFDIKVEIGGVFFNDNDLMAFIIVPLVLGALALFIRYTRIGIAVRAVAERSDRASTLGVPVGRIQTIVWVITAVLAFITVFLRAGVSSFPIGSALAVTVLVRALAAVVLGHMDNFPRIAAAAIGLGIVEQAIVFDTGRDLYVFPVLFVIIVVGLLLEPRGNGSRVDDQAVSSWQAAREVRPIPTELRSIPAVRWAAALPVALVDPLRPDAPPVALGQQAPDRHGHRDRLHRRGVVGRCSPAGPATSASVRWRSRPWEAPWVGGPPRAPAGISAWRSWPPAWRVRSWPPSWASPPPRAGGLTLGRHHARARARGPLLAAQPRVLRLGAARPLRHRPHVVRHHRDQVPDELLLPHAGPPRRRHRGGLRRATEPNRPGAHRAAGEPRAAEAFGINSLRTMLAGFGSPASSPPSPACSSCTTSTWSAKTSSTTRSRPRPSLRVFAIVVIGGMASVPGAILGAVYVFGMQYYMLPEWRFLATGIGLLAILLILPGGLGAGLAEARDGLLRWYARRHEHPRPEPGRGPTGRCAAGDPGDGRGRRRGRRAAGDRRGRGDGAVTMAEPIEAAVDRDRRPLFSIAGHTVRRPRGPRRYFDDITAGYALYPLIILFGLNAVDELDRTVFGVLGPEIRDSFGLTNQGYLTLIALTLLGGLLLEVPLAYYADRLHRARIAVLGAAVWAVFGLLTGLATTILMLVIARSGAGMGRAVVTPTHNSLLSDYYPTEVRADVFGFHRLANALGAFIGPVVGGVLAEAFGWRVPFFVFVIPSIVFVVLGLRLREPGAATTSDGRPAPPRRSSTPTSNHRHGPSPSASSGRSARSGGSGTRCRSWPPR